MLNCRHVISFNLVMCRWRRCWEYCVLCWYWWWYQSHHVVLRMADSWSNRRPGCLTSSIYSNSKSSFECRLADGHWCMPSVFLTSKTCTFYHYTGHLHAASNTSMHETEWCMLRLSIIPTVHQNWHQRADKRLGDLLAAFSGQRWGWKTPRGPRGGARYCLFVLKVPLS